VIREATHDDIPRMVKYHHDAMHEGVFGDQLTWDLDSAVRHFVSFIDDKDKRCLVSDNGLLCVYLGSPHFTSDTLLMEQGFYVVPEKRGSMDAYRLFKKGVKWGKEMGAKGLWFMTSTGIDIQKSEKFFNGMGATTIGNVFYNNFKE